MAGGNHHVKLLIFLILCAALAAAWTSAQDGPGTLVADRGKDTQSTPALKTRDRPIRVDTTMVLVPVTVTDPLNRLVTGLEREHFEVYEGKDQQKIVSFSSEDVPLSLGLVFDASGSMANKMDKARMAVLQFFKTANPRDEFFLVDFNDSPRMISDFTRSLEEIQNKLIFTAARGRTALLDAIYLGINHMRHAENGKKAILIISDGGDNHSRYTENEIKSLVKESDVQLYAIGIYNAYGARPTPEEMDGTGRGDRRAAVPGGQPQRSAGHRRQDRHRAEKPVPAGLRP